MATNTWIPLTEYSSKYSVSISTLRRRIKAGRVEYTQSEGKYLLKNAPLAKHDFVQDQSVNAPTNINAELTSASEVKTDEAAVNFPPQKQEEMASSPIFSTANKLLNEIKKAYALILQEKEEQIVQLKEEVSDLKTLVRVLEADNERLNGSVKEANAKEALARESSSKEAETKKAASSEAASIESWLETF